MNIKKALTIGKYAMIAIAGIAGLAEGFISSRLNDIKYEEKIDKQLETNQTKEP